jgi:hypothetical protein
LEDRWRQPGEHDRQPDPRLHRRPGQRVGQPDHFGEPSAAAGADPAVPHAHDVARIEAVDVGERVDGHHRFDERAAAGQRPGREQRRRQRDAVDFAHLVGEEPSSVHAQARVPPTVALGDEHLRVGARRSAPGVEQFSRRVAAEHTPALHEQEGRPRPEGVGQLERCVGVHVGEESDVAGPA